MYWVKANERFARPVRWVVALHGSNVVPVELYGIRAGSVSAGHRVLGSQSVPVSDFEDYLKKLEENAVLVSQESRRQKIEFGAHRGCHRAWAAALLPTMNFSKRSSTSTSIQLLRLANSRSVSWPCHVKS